MSYSVLISVKIGGKYSSVQTLESLIKSIENKIYTKNFLILFFVEDSVHYEVVKYLNNIKKKNLKIFFFKNLSWYEWTKKSFDISLKFSYLFLIHDDIIFLTKNFDLKIHNKIKSIKDIGCIALKDPSYLNGVYKTQFRKGFYKDRIFLKKGLSATLLEFKNQKPFWHIKNLKLKKIFKIMKLDNNFFIDFYKTAFLSLEKLEFPKHVIRCHAPYNDLVCLKTENIRYLKNICDFDINHGLNADEDLGLECLKLGLQNVFIPDVYYYHDISIYGANSTSHIINNRKKCDKIFKNKWGFELLNDNLSTEEMIGIVNKMEKIYGNKLTWTKNFDSFDWQYV